jgi:hypothetical protein
MWSCETRNKERLPIHNLKKIREENASDVQHIHVFNSLQRVVLRIMSSENFCVCVCVFACGVHLWYTRTLWIQNFGCFAFTGFIPAIQCFTKSLE